MSGTSEAQNTHVSETMNTLEEKLWIDTSVAGLPRYENDEYFHVSKDVQGNPWVICTLEVF